MVIRPSEGQKLIFQILPESPATVSYRLINFPARLLLESARLFGQAEEFLGGGQISQICQKYAKLTGVTAW
jgi:hypothetical protein